MSQGMISISLCAEIQPRLIFRKFSLQVGFATVLAARVGAQAGFATVLAARVGAQANS